MPAKQLSIHHQQLGIYPKIYPKHLTAMIHVQALTGGFERHQFLPRSLCSRHNVELQCQCCAHSVHRGL